MKKIIFASLASVAWLIMLLSALSVSDGVHADDLKQDAILLTIFMRHDQSKTLAEINAHLNKTGFWKKFPPQGTEVVSWYVMMGIGQVVVHSAFRPTSCAQSTWPSSKMPGVRTGQSFIQRTIIKQSGKQNARNESRGRDKTPHPSPPRAYP